MRFLPLASIAMCGGAFMIQPQPTPYKWRLPKGFPEPLVPADNPMSHAKVELGRYLFFDKRLSGNGKQSCATCHRPEFAFSDDKPVSLGSTGEPGIRKAMSLVNVAYSRTLTWSNPKQLRLEDQALVPMFGTHPVELGLNPDNRFLKVLAADAKYASLFVAAFPKEDNRVTLTNVTKAIACFERTMISGDSPYDRYHFQNDNAAISNLAKKGEELYFSRQFSCFHCHGGFNFSDSTVSKVDPERESTFHNTGLYNVAGPTSYPSPNIGLSEHTGQALDVGKFKAPSLRNINLRAPYMHDGSVANLDDVLDHYAAGGRTIRTGPFAGVGSKNPNRDRFVRGFALSPGDRQALHAFLNTLTDMKFLNDPSFQDPWVRGAVKSGPVVRRKSIER